MNRQNFDFEFGKKHGVNSFQLTDNLTVFRKPLEIWNEETDESIKFKNIDELLKYKIDGVTVWEIIEQKDTLYGDLTIHGGRGSGSSNNKTFKMSHAGGSGGGLGIGGVVAVGKTNTYSVLKVDGRFDSSGFSKMIKKASREGIKGKSYDDAVDKMLKANAKKYGYTYTKTKTKV